MLKPKENKMKIEINKQIIESTLINSQPFLDKKDATQITSHIFIYTEGQNCIFKSTDLEIGLSIKVKNIKILKEGSFTVSGKKFLDIIRILNDDIVSLEIINDLLIIKQGKTRFQLPTFDYKLFPVFPKMSNKAKISLDSTLLIKSLKKIVSSIDNNNPKHELNGALIDIKNNRGIIIRNIEAGSTAEHNGLQNGDIIIGINRMVIHNIKELQQIYIFMKNVSYCFEL